jgi:iron complex outermembrane receptor protein
LELNFITDNAGKSSVTGAEVELTFAATDNLLLSLNYGYAKSEFIKYNSDEYYRLTGINDPDLLNGGNVSGNESPRSPKQSASFSALYNRSINADMAWFARTDYSYAAKQWVSEANLAYSGDVHMWNARAGLETDQWTLTFYVDNILGEDAPTMIQNFPVLDVSAVAGTDFTPPVNPLQRLYDPELQQFVYPSGLQLTPRRDTNYGVLLGFRF